VLPWPKQRQRRGAPNGCPKLAPLFGAAKPSNRLLEQQVGAASTAVALKIPIFARPKISTIATPKSARLLLEGANLHDIVPADMLNMSEVRLPRSPVIPAVLAIIGLLAAAYIALTGLGSDPATSSAAVVNDVAVDGEIVEVDLTAPFPAAQLGADTVNATFLGIPIGSANVEGGAIDPGYLKYTGAGVIEVTPDADESSSFPLRATNSPYPTAPFVVAAMVALGGLGSVQSNLKAMRARRIRISPYIGLAISGAIAGAGLAVLAMLVLSTPTSISSIIGPAAALAAGSVFLGEAYRRWRRRRRLKHVTVATARR